ncbi:hypothetical protein CLV84_3707 [Neolewinella xylanilytica]|uniref:Uncharacterized protein n=1 Tax=Neolewinella xylanilytica TaxID=1514080 RepID=A0A2S6I0S6_9BACT|nr:hypothetical protein [Neolewinella xylanilytica]PPK84546.1 hypothetical protein CLV84_3707 [Neolewinella xylanilytica]
MTTRHPYLISWFSGSFYFGIFLMVMAAGAAVREQLINGSWYVESLLATFAMGLLFLYFSGKPMIDERIRLLKFKALASGFVVSSILFSILNYLVTYPDGRQTDALSSNCFAIACLSVAFFAYQILKQRE